MELGINVMAAIFTPFQRQLQLKTFLTSISNGIYKILLKLSLLFLFIYCMSELVLDG